LMGSHDVPRGVNGCDDEINRALTSLSVSGLRHWGLFTLF